jgi:hypothetical protein
MLTIDGKTDRLRMPRDERRVHVAPIGLEFLQAEGRQAAEAEEHPYHALS